MNFKIIVVILNEFLKAVNNVRTTLERKVEQND